MPFSFVTHGTIKPKKKKLLKFWILKILGQGVVSCSKQVKGGLIDCLGMVRKHEGGGGYVVCV